MIGTTTFGQAALALATGLALGAFFFLSLWWTSRRVLTVRWPSLWLGATFAVRMAVLLGGVFFVTRGRLPDTVLSVVGIWLARGVVVNRVGRPEDGGDGRWKFH